jgi:hypothetical protein
MYASSLAAFWGSTTQIVLSVVLLVVVIIVVKVLKNRGA